MKRGREGGARGAGAPTLRPAAALPARPAASGRKPREERAPTVTAKARRTRRIGITCYSHFGGSGVVATELGMALARRGFEVHFIAKVLSEHNGNVSRAAQALGISRVALQKKMKEYGLR